MKLRSALGLIVGIGSAACGDLIPEGPDPNLRPDAASDAAASDAASDASALGDGGVSIKRGARVVSAAPSYALVEDRYRYTPKTNTKARSLELASAPKGMTLSAGSLEWTPGAEQVGLHRVQLRALGDEENAEQEFQVAVATSTLRAEGEASEAEGGSIFAGSPSADGIAGAGVRVPPRALRGAAQITVSELDQAPPMPNASGSVRAVRFGPVGQVFDSPAQVTLPLPEDIVHAKARIGTYVYDPAGRWRRVPLTAADLDNGLVTARAQHFSIYAAVQSALDLELALAPAGSDSGCEGLLGRAVLSSPFSEVELGSVNNLSESLRALVGGEAPSVQDLLRLPQFAGSLRVVQAFELVELHGASELVREQRLLATTLYLPGDGSATITHADAQGNALAVERYPQPLLELPELELRLRGAATAVRFASGEGGELALAARVHLAHYPGDASLDPVNADDLGLAAVERAPVAAGGQLAVSDLDCDGLIDGFDPLDERLSARIEALPASVTSVFPGERVSLRARVLRGGDQVASSWSMLDGAAASLSASEQADAREFSAESAGRYLVSFRAQVAERTLEHVFAIDVRERPALDTPPSCRPSRELDTGRVGEAIALSAIASDRESAASALQIEWGLVGGSEEQPSLIPAAALFARGDRARFSPREPGNYTVGCRAFDGQSHGPIGALALSVVAGEQSRAPVDFALSPMVATIAPGREIRLRASASDPDGDALSFAWHVEGAPAGEPQSAGQESILALTPEVAGVVRVEVSVTDGHTPPLHALAHVLVAQGPRGTVDGDRDGWPAGTGPLGDCDDSDPKVHPTARDRCGDGRDGDCDGSAQESDCDYDGVTSAEGDCDDTNPNRHPDALELCDGLDNDCDQVRDENFSVGKPCLVGEGVCEAQGTFSCSADGLFVLCTAAPRLPQAERCDRVDNDCDGLVDEEDACTSGSNGEDAGVSDAGPPVRDGGSDSTRSDAGAPDADGLDGGVDDAALRDAAAPLPTRDAGEADGGSSCTSEVCDRLDNDCDGLVDDVDYLPCSTGIEGHCNYGIVECAADGPVCVPDRSLPEICNQLDDDCDGLVNEELVCTCEPGAGENCTDGLDNDCDGLFDREDADCSQSCEPAAEEYCYDGVDNNCNGLIDGADPQCCYYQGPEVCDDGIDNDCDLLVDRGDSECGAQTVLGESCVNPEWLDPGFARGGTFTGAKDDVYSSCYAGGADRVYSFHMPEAGEISVRYSGPQPYAWSLQSGACDQEFQQLGEYACNGPDRLYLPAGSWFLVLEGQSGPFEVTVQVLSGAADAGTTTTTSQITSTR